MTGATLRIDRREQIPAAISRLQAAGAHHRAALLQAVYRGELAHYEVARDTSASTVKLFLACADLPSLVLIGDDDLLPTGPAGWRTAPRLLRWARCTVIHAAAGSAPQYAEFVQGARALGRVLLVETSSAFALEWRDAALAMQPRGAVRLILPESGVHPVPPSVEAMH